MEEEFYTDFLADYAEILRRFQGSFHQANCTALACAIDAYFTSGIVNRPSGFNASSSFILTSGTPLVRAGLTSIINRVNRGSNGNHLVLEAENTSGERHHFANLIKINDDVYYVDGFNSQSPICSTNVHGYLSWATVFHYSIGLRVRISAD